MQRRFNECKSQNENKMTMFTDCFNQRDKVGFGLAAAPLKHGRRLPDKPLLTAEAATLLAAVKICALKKTQ